MNKNKTRKKKIFAAAGAVLVIALAIAAYFFIPYAKRHYVTVSVDMEQAAAMEHVDLGGKKILTVYFTRVGNSDFEEAVDAVSSASLMEDDGNLVGNSQLLAAMVQNCVGGDIYPIRTEKRYPSSYDDTVSAARDEMDSDETVALSGELPDIRSYDTVILIYPVWWGTIPNAVRTFLESVDLSGVTIYPVAAHGGSGAGKSVQDIRTIGKGDVSDNVLEVFDDDTAGAAGAVEEWLKSLQGQD